MRIFCRAFLKPLKMYTREDFGKLYCDIVKINDDNYKVDICDNVNGIVGMYFNTYKALTIKEGIEYFINHLQDEKVIFKKETEDENI